MEGNNTDCYKVSLLRIGYAMIQAESPKEAKRKAGMLSEKDIHWLEGQDELSGPYLVTDIERTDCKKAPRKGEAKDGRQQGPGP